MGLFKPEIGLVFWMLVVFLIILAILAKYAWPVIIRSIEQRADFIDSGVKFTREAKQRLDEVETKVEEMLAETIGCFTGNRTDETGDDRERKKRSCR
jgi:F-type H+-transporting ATPase subunit b